MSSKRTVIAVGIGSVLGLLVLSGVGSGQRGGESASELGFVGRFLVRLVVYLVLGGALVGFGPQYARESVTDLHEDPPNAFAWGLLVGVLVPMVLLVVWGVSDAMLGRTIGLLVTAPGAILWLVVGVVGMLVAVAWIGDLLTGSTIQPGLGTVVGAFVVSFLGALPVVGDPFLWTVGFFGAGVVARRLFYWWEGRHGESESTRGRSPSSSGVGSAGRY